MTGHPKASQPFFRIELFAFQVDDLLDAFGELCDQLPLAAVVNDTCGCVCTVDSPQIIFLAENHIIQQFILMEFMVYTNG